MPETTFERVNDFTSVRISLASPEDIRSWSYGEVKKPETINYRTYRAEKDGLFCERIFGPERDWECFCGKYRGMKHKGIVCDRCGVKVTHSRVRRKRMGHITLAAPVVHIWFFKAMPSRLATTLDIKTSALERIIYFQDYVVVNPGETPLKPRQLLSEGEYRAAREQYGEKFDAKMGAEAIRELLTGLDLPALARQLRDELRSTHSKQRAKDITKRLRLIEALKDSNNKPEWMVLEVIPVIPPDLRPLVLLESGNFATSDLNDLYRRIINRNNRLKKLIDLNAPEVIIRNEKRMLQQAVDALFDNARCKRPVLGSSNRPLKSLTDMIKGKQGRFRENLLGKRVDYSARSVIVVGPDLKLHQCGLPKKIALELYQPFIIRRLRELGHAETIKSAKKMIERKEEPVWDILEEVITGHPVLLNRAPTLHRMGIQAFQPVLVEGNAIKIHPLVCRGFNADFDGDQMAVHLPLSVEAQVEAHTLMMSTNNVFSPASGEPIIAPSQDIVLGIFYLTCDRVGEKGEGMKFFGAGEVFLAYQQKKLGLHARIFVRIKDRPEVRTATSVQQPAGASALYETTVGRVIFNDVLPREMAYYNKTLDQKGIDGIIHDCHKLLGRERTIRILDDIKELGFRQATLAGLSFATSDLVMPPEKEQIVKTTEVEVSKIEKHFEQGAITEGERYNLIIDAWTHATESVAEAMMKHLRSDTREGRPYLNPIRLMVESGARGSLQQIRQLAGMRGLMAKPSGRIIETPIKANFREGLRVLEYFSSTHGARKGLADTALKTADSGYLTRKLADVAQNVVVCMLDCGTLNGITKGIVRKGDAIEVPLSRSIRGRVARDNIVSLVDDQLIVAENELITEATAKRLEELGFEKIRVRSPLTCEAPIGICERCYGMDLSRGELAEEGLAVGIIGAQSIGEPGTQLTMRTFHIGGTASRRIEEHEVRAKKAGVVKYHNLNVVKNPKGETLALTRNGELHILDDKGRELERVPVPAGAVILVEPDSKVAQKKTLARWDPHMVPILAEVSGRVRFEDIVENKTVREEIDPASKVRRKVIIEHKGDLHPQIVVEEANGDILGAYPIPEKAFIEVEEGENITAGMLLAKTPREITRTQDITGGLPRVTEVFEARKPKDPAVMSEIEGVVELGETRRGKMSIIVRTDSGMEREHLVPRGRHLRVHRGARVRVGEALTEGPLVPQDILRISGEEEVQQYLLREIQNVYRSQNVRIDDKHIEIIVSQMMRKVRVDDPGDTKFLPGSLVDRFAFKQENRRTEATGGKAAVASPVLMGITKAALQSDSFISAASFQETPKVLTEAALAARSDDLWGLKENVIVGRLIPAGTGFKSHLAAMVAKPELPQQAAALESPEETDGNGKESE
ncbi:MAG: DNA-directed RNA polymerase subunit beta' [Candidatus Brocadiia bacterium]